MAMPHSLKICMLITLSAMSVEATVAAQETPAPLILIVPSDVGFHPNMSGLMFDWIASATNKRGAGQIKAFHDATAGVDWNDLAVRNFACMGIPAGAACRAIFNFDGTDDALLQKVQATGSPRVLALSVMQLFDGAFYRLNATVREVELHNGHLQNVRAYTAIYETLPPEDLLERGKSDPGVLWKYWLDKPSSRLEQEGRESISEVVAMLGSLEKAVSGDEKSDPQGWKDLKKISVLEADGRARCHGLCSPTRVFKDDGPRIWITSSSVNGSFGRTLVSLDANAARHNANFMAYTLLPTLDWKWAVLPKD